MACVLNDGSNCISGHPGQAARDVQQYQIPLTSGNDRPKSRSSTRLGPQLEYRHLAGVNKNKGIFNTLKSKKAEERDGWGDECRNKTKGNTISLHILSKHTVDSKEVDPRSSRKEEIQVSWIGVFAFHRGKEKEGFATLKHSSRARTTAVPTAETQFGANAIFPISTAGEASR